jgi:hypothetical protein
MSASDQIWRAGGCHCGSVRFEALLADEVEAQTCNCSMCEKVGFVHVIVPASRFRLLQGAEHITTYTFNTGVAQHTFCSVCGVKPFYRPRSNPDGWSVNGRCLDAHTKPALQLSEFDGHNWEAHAEDLAHLSKEGQT